MKTKTNRYFWKEGKSDEILDRNGNHIGFADAGWAKRIIELHNNLVLELRGETPVKTYGVEDLYEDFHP